MKKILLTMIATATLTGTFAQSEKKVKVGLAYQAAIGLNTPTTKRIESNGAGFSNTIGINANFGLNDKIEFSTGLEFDFESLRYKSANATYYRYNDSEIYKKEDYPSPNNLKTYRLTERTYKTTFVSIPTMLKLNMKPIGAFTPYGKFGARTSILVKSFVNDKGFDATNPLSEVAQENEKMTTSRDLFFLRSSIGIGGGTEWEFAGGTSVFAELAFYYAFTPAFFSGNSEDKNHMYNLPTLSEPQITYFSNKAVQKHIALKIGIMF